MKKQLYFFVILFFIFVTSCSQSYLALRSLKTHSVKSITFVVDSLLKIQDSPHEMGLVVITDNNDTLKSKGMLKGKLAWKNFDVKIQGAKFSNGKFTILNTSLSNYTPYIPISFSSIFERDKQFFDTIPLNYETSVEIYPTRSFNTFPGSKINLGMDIVYNNKERRTYKNISKINNFDEYYDVLLRASSFNKSVFEINSDPLDLPDHKSGIVVRSRLNHDVSDVFEVDVDYRNNYIYYADGNRGLSGFSGSSGSSGGEGSSGGNGQNGEHGRNGSSGDDLDIYVDAYKDTILKKTMVKVYLGNVETHKVNRYLIDPDGGSLYISSTGGSGGEGGYGGSGGEGGKGADGEIYTEIIKEIVIKKDTAGHEIRTEIPKTITRQRPGRNGGNGGDGGFGGDGGNGGNGGYLIVYYTYSAQPYLKLLNINVSGGAAGYGGNGGSGGAGGSGGKGDPNGRNGRSGRNASGGSSGYSGGRGRVEYKPINEIPWQN